MSTKTFVYLIGSSGGPFKIGVAENVKKRCGELNIGNPNYLRIWHTLEFDSTEEAETAELELHFHYKDAHIRGEWFDLLENDVSAIQRQMNIIQTMSAHMPCAPEGWTLERKSCDEFTAAVCRKARGALGLTQKELAEKADVSVITLMKFESEESTPQIETLEALKEALASEGIEFVKEAPGSPMKILI